MALQTWANLNAKNQNNQTPVSQPDPGVIGKVSNFFSNLSSHISNVSASQPAGPDFSNPSQSPIIKYGQNVMGDINNDSADIINNIKTPIANTQGSIDPATGFQQSNIAKGALESGFAITGDALDAVTSPVQEGFKGIFGPVNDYLSNLGANDKVKTQGQQALDQINQHLQQTPELAKNLDTINKIISSAGVITGADEGGQELDKGLNRINNPTLSSQSLQNIAAGANPTTEIPTESSPFSKISAPSSTEIPSSQTGITDATPNYNEKMIGQHVMTPDSTDAQGNPVKGKITSRIASENTKYTGERPVTTSASEHSAGTEVNKIKDYPHGNTGTNLEKSLSIEKTISKKAESMRSGLQDEDKNNPLDTQAEKSKMDSLVKSNLPKDIQEKLGFVSLTDEAKMTPTQKAYREALMSQQEETLPKTAVGRYYQKVLDELNAYDGTREGKLDLRQNLDAAYKNARGKLAFGTDSQNALDETHDDIRDSINKDLNSSTKNTDVKSSLEEQTDLYKAKKVIEDKAKGEAGNKTGRLEQKHPSIKFVKRQLARKAVSVPLTVGATAAGVPLITAAAKKLLSGSGAKEKALK